MNFLIVRKLHWEEVPDFYDEKYGRSTEWALLFCSNTDGIDPRLTQDIEKIHNKIVEEMNEQSEDNESLGFEHYTLEYVVLDISSSSLIEFSDAEFPDNKTIFDSYDPNNFYHDHFKVNIETKVKKGKVKKCKAKKGKADYEDSGDDE
jgi:hypothetical protein